MATPYYGWILPTVGASADAWGGLINDAFTTQDTQLASPANTFKGNNTGSTAASINLTVTQATAMLNPFVGDSGSGGVKGLAPATVAGDKRKVLTGAGTWQSGYGRAFGCIITTTNLNGSQPTLSGAMNVASISTVSVVGSVAAATLTFTDALDSSTYAVVGSAGAGNFGGVGYGSRTTTTVIIYWETVAGNPTELSVCGF